MLKNYFLPLFTIILFSFFFNTIYAQTIQWQRSIGGSQVEWNEVLELTTDGNYLLGGYSDSNISGDKSTNSKGNSDYWIVKIDKSNGSVIWEKSFGGNDRDFLISTQQTSDGGYILAGYSSSGNNGDKTEASRGYDDYWVIKLDSNRNIIWQKTYGGNSIDRLNSIIEINDGGYLLGGTSESNSSGEKTENSKGSNDFWVIKINSSGNIEWDKTYGGNGMDQLTSIIKGVDGGYILAGNSNSNISGDKSENSRGSEDFWILKINNSGGIIWQKTIGGNNGEGLSCIKSTFDNNYILGGTSSSSISGEKTENTAVTDGWIIKINSSGNIIWQKNIGGNSTDSLAALRQTKNGGYIIALMSYSDISGNKTENGYGSEDYWIVKLDELGNFEWDKTIGGNSTDQIHAILEDDAGAIVASGWSQSGISGNKTVNTNGQRDFWVVKIGKCDQNLTISSNSPLCSSNTLELKASGGTNYIWTGPNGFSSTLQNPVIPNASITNSGKYNCAISGTGDCNDTLTIDIVIGDTNPPIPSISTLPTISGDCSTIVSIPSATDSCDGLILATTSNPIINLSQGTHTIVWKYTDSNGNYTTQNQTVIISNQAITSVTSPQNFCIQQNATLNNIIITGQNIKWYDSLSNGNNLANNSLLQNETTYYASQTINGCESDRVPVRINIQTTSTPSVDSNQSFCSSENPTLSTIAITGTAIKWYDINGNNLNDSTTLQNNLSYYVTQTINNCESSTRLPITISIINPFLATNFEKSFCNTSNDNFELVNLPVYNSNLITNPNEYSFNYYITLLGAENELSTVKITNPNNFKISLGENKIYVRINSNTPCFAIAELKLSLFPKPNILINDLMPICENSSITINAGSNFTNYLWSTGATTPFIVIANPGDYSVLVSKDYSSISCSTNKNFSVKKSTLANITSIETKDWTDTNNSIIIYTTGTGDYEYSLDGMHYQANNEFSNLANGKYTISVRDKNGCGIVNDTVYLLMYPKFFTPNGDGFNDTWKIKFSDNETDIVIKIFDRYGKLIKELSQNNTWDGTYLGNQLPADDYWFTAMRPNTDTEYKGHFSLKR
jgi:gliding motility-associated-like protein